MYILYVYIYKFICIYICLYMHVYIYICTYIRQSMAEGFLNGVANLFFKRCGYKAFLVRRQKTTNVTRIASVSLKNDESLALRACTTPKATNVSHFARARLNKTTTVSHFAHARLKKRRQSRISRLHYNQKSDQCPAFRACTTPKTTTVPRFALARLKTATTV